MDVVEGGWEVCMGRYMCVCAGGPGVEGVWRRFNSRPRYNVLGCLPTRCLLLRLGLKGKSFQMGLSKLRRLLV